MCKNSCDTMMIIFAVSVSMYSYSICFIFSLIITHHVESLHLPRHPVTAAVFGSTIQEKFFVRIYAW